MGMFVDYIENECERLLQESPQFTELQREDHELLDEYPFLNMITDSNGVTKVLDLNYAEAANEASTTGTVPNDAVDAVIVTVDEREIILFRLGDDVQAALGLNSPGLRVLGVVAAPYRVLAQRVEGVAEHGGQCFGHVSLAPERPADPVSEFQRAVAKVLAVAFGEFRIGGNGVGGAVADGLERDAAHRRVAVRRAALDGNGPVVFDREDIAYVMHAAFDAGVWRPAASQPDFRVAGIPEQRCRLSRVIDLPRA